jgi:hypothetical protein
MVRGIMLRASAGLAVVLTTGAVLVATGSSATATQGQPVIAGQINTATSYTEVATTESGVAALLGVNTGSDSTGVQGNGSSYGTVGVGLTGVFGVTTGAGRSTGSGVYGLANDAGSGVYGENDGLGYGVTGRATNTGGGTGVLGDAPNGIGVEADSATGSALNVNGKATFSRSGIVTVAAGTNSLTVTLGGVTTASMVLATAQQPKAVYVKAAVPGSGSFTIRLTGKAPTGGLIVAYFVLN